MIKRYYIFLFLLDKEHRNYIFISSSSDRLPMLRCILAELVIDVRTAFLITVFKALFTSFFFQVIIIDRTCDIGNCRPCGC